MPENNKLVLIIEDDSDIREILKEFLESEGCEVATAVNGKEGLKCLDELSKTNQPKLILLDLFMPVMDGREFLKAMKETRAQLQGKIPVIVLSAAPPLGEDVKEARELSTGFIKKPIDLDGFLEVVKQFVA